MNFVWISMEVMMKMMRITVRLILRHYCGSFWIRRITQYELSHCQAIDIDQTSTEGFRVSHYSNNFVFFLGMKLIMIINWIVNTFLSFLENIWNDIFLGKGLYGVDDDDDGPGAFNFVTILRNWFGKIAWNGLFAAILSIFFFSFEPFKSLLWLENN